MATRLDEQASRSEPANPSTTPAIDLAAVRARQQATWATGDYAVVGATLQIVAEELCEAVDLRSGQRVLDVATGSGNAAIAAARRWCEVVGVDYVPSLLARGRERAAAEALPVSFEEGDADRLPFADASFDVVLSTFGVMFAADQDRAAGELLRVCRSGGKIGLASWTPAGFIGQMLRTIGKYVPPVPGLKAPTLWGSEPRLHELFGSRATIASTTLRSFSFRYRSPRHFLDVFRTYYGPMFKAFAAVDERGREQLERDLVSLIESMNRSGDETLVLPSEYLQAVLTKR